MGSCAAPSAKGDDKFITTDYLQQCREKDAIKLKDNFDIIGMLSYGKENFIAMSHTKSELTGGKRRYRIKN
ncbi:hypothetical protein [Escherichia coli]|uniref:hypothetical protein n=1 Tax=Escherichia coli TaxID=562 RepID=UPI00186B7D78|nr:hypothetical protein [Escherichia coli]MBE4662981.1 hypothetical protein [Escherichia coli]